MPPMRGARLGSEIGRNLDEHGPSVPQAHGDRVVDLPGCLLGTRQADRALRDVPIDVDLHAVVAERVMEQPVLVSVPSVRVAAD